VKRSLPKVLIVVAILALGVVFSLPAAHASVVYGLDPFTSTTIDSRWSASPGIPVQTTAPYTPNETFLGINSLYGISRNTMTLALSGLPSHTGLRVEFDLYIIHSWDGNNTSLDVSTPRGPDGWQFAVVGQNPLVDTTFSNVFLDGYHQSYSPTNLVGPGDFVAQTGNSGINTLTYGDYFGTNSVYHFAFDIPHTSGSVQLAFTGSPTQSIDDESWGLDNVKVTAVPLPPSVLLLGTGLLGLVGLRR
jgi:hypothetical protein